MNYVRAREILEACYESLEAGQEPDLARLCGDDRDLLEHVARMLQRERNVMRHPRTADPALSAHRPPPPPTTTASTPQRIGEFTILEPLGAGGMSHVYRARQESLSREVALKVLRADIVATETGRLRFQREATITAALDHPNIAPVYAAGEADGHVYLAMKLLHGLPLDRCNLPLAPMQVAALGLGAANALQAAHDIGVIHRDVKPANIVVEAGVAFVLDFGLAVFTHGGGTLTRPDSTPGTLIYLAPEVVQRRTNGLDPRLDVYGLGASLYEAAAGRPPFDATNPIRALHQILHHDPTPLRLTGRDRDLETIIARAMDKSPQRRFPTAADMAAELQRFVDGLPIRSRPISWPERAWRLMRRNRATTALVLLSSLLILTLGVVLLLQQQHRLGQAKAASDKVQSLLGNGDLASAAVELDLAVREHGATARNEALRHELASERQLQTLTATLQGPTAHANPETLRTLVRELTASETAAAATHRANAAVAIATRIIDDDPLNHQPLAPTTQSVWPRTAAAMRAWATKSNARAALRPLPPSGEPLDHLFAALAMRLSDAQPRDVERELRLANVEGATGDAVRYSIALALEGQERVQEAYDMHSRLANSPAYATLSSCASARLAALLGNEEAARRHLAAGIASAQMNPHLQILTFPAELEVLHEIGDLTAFQRRWLELQPRLEHMPQYWLRGGYATYDLATATGDGTMVERARQFFQRGLECRPDARRRAALELAIVQLDWSVSDGPSAVEPLPANAETEAARTALMALAKRAEALGSATQAAGNKSISAPALLVAAQAYRAAGDRQRGWLLLETCCQNSDGADVLARFAWQVGWRVANVHLDEEARADGGDLDADSGPPLDVAAATAVVRALRVVDRKRSGALVDDEALREAKMGLFLCAYHGANAGLALPMAFELLSGSAGDGANTDAQEAMQLLCQQAVGNGGIPLTRIPVDDDGRAQTHVSTQLLGALSALQQAVDSGQMQAPQVRELLQRWRQHSLLAPTIANGTASWVTLWSQVAAFEARLAN